MIENLGAFLEQLGSNLGEYTIDRVDFGEGTSAELALSLNESRAAGVGLHRVAIYLADEGQSLAFVVNITTDIEEALYGMVLSETNDTNLSGQLLPTFSVAACDDESQMVSGQAVLLVRATYLLCFPPLHASKQGVLLDLVRYSLEQFLIEVSHWYEDLLEFVSTTSVH